MTPTLDDSDIEMASGGNDSDGDYVLVGESEEFRRLKQKKLQLQSQLDAVGMNLDSVEETKPTIAKGPEALKPDYTVSKPWAFPAQFGVTNTIRFSWSIQIYYSVTPMHLNLWYPPIIGPL